MKKYKLILFISALLVLSAKSTSAQLPELYHIVLLKGIVVKHALSIPEFSYFDFVFKLKGKAYTLGVIPRDKYNKPLGSIIMLDAKTARPPKLLKNKIKGSLYLDVETMNEQDVDGSEDYVLTPKKCTKRECEGSDYVSYRFNNKEDNTLTNLRFGRAVKAFDLNPSPPY